MVRSLLGGIQSKDLYQSDSYSVLQSHMETQDKYRWLKAGLVIFVLLFIVANIISWIWMPFLPWMEERDAGEEVIEQTYDAEQAIQNYEWFRQQYRDIQSQRNIIDNNYDELERFYETYGEDPDEWSRTAQERHSRIQQRITGNQNALERMIADYNARSDQANNALFKCQLPYQVDDRFAVRGPPGSGQAEQPQDVDVNGERVDTDASIPNPSECDGLPEEIRQEADS